MGILNTLFKSTIDKRVNRITQNLIQPALTNLYNANFFRLFGDGVPVFQANQFDFIKKGFNAVGAVFEAVDIIQKKVVACPRIVYRIKDEKEYKKYLNYSKSHATLGKALLAKAKGLEEVTQPQIEKLLEQPNPQQNGDEMFENLAGFFLVKGNSYLYGTGSNPSNKKWSEIYGLPTEMKIVAGGPMEPVKEYIVECWTSDPFPAPQIKHFKTWNPNYDPQGRQLYGLSPLTAYLYSLDILKNADIQADKQLKNGGALGLITPENKEDQLNDDQKKDMHERFVTAHGSSDKLSRYIPASIALKWTKIGLDPAELQMLELSGAKADDVYRAYHIPLQFRNQDSATYNNLPVANRKFIFDAVAPICRKLEIGLTEFICTPYNTATEKYVIHLDYMALPELNDDMKAIIEWLGAMPYLTPNEKREVIGFARLSDPGMDKIFINRNTVLIDDVVAGKVNTQPNNSSGSDQVN